MQHDIDVADGGKVLGVRAIAGENDAPGDRSR